MVEIFIAYEIWKSYDRDRDRDSDLNFGNRAYALVVVFNDSLSLYMPNWSKIRSHRSYFIQYVHTFLSLIRLKYDFKVSIKCHKNYHINLNNWVLKVSFQDRETGQILFDILWINCYFGFGEPRTRLKSGSFIYNAKL